MKQFLCAGAALMALAACDGNTITVFPPVGGGGTVIPPTSNCDTGVECQGDVTFVAYDEDTDTLTIAGTPFDDDNINGDYVRVPGNDIAAAGGTWLAYENAPVGLSPYTAYIRASASGQVSAGVVNNDDYFDYGYGGSFYAVNGGVSVPVAGLATYTGDYVGLRVFDGSDGLEVATGDVDMEVDFGDERIRGFITNRAIQGGGALEDLVLNDGVITGGSFSGTAISRDGGGAVIEEGTYEGQFAGTGASELVGIFIVQDTTDAINVQETGVYTATQDP